MLSKGERLSLALLLFGVALFVAGVKMAGSLMGYNLAKEVGRGLKLTLQFAEKNYPPSEPFVDIGFSVLGNRDIIHIDRINNRVTSDRNFIYRYKGYTVRCSVVYQPREKSYLITCGAE